MKTRHLRIVSVLWGICLAITPAVLLAQRESLEIEVLKEEDLPAQTDAEIAIRQALRKKVNLNLKEATLEEIARALSEEFAINIAVDRAALDDAGIDLNDTYDMHYKNVTLRTAIRVTLEAADLTYHVSNEQLLFTSTDAWLTSIMIYDVTDLLAAGEPRQRFAVVRRGIVSSSFEFQQMIDLIQQACVPDEWDHVGGAGTMTAAELNGKQLLLVSQNEPGHEAVEEFLQKLRKAGGVLAAEKPAEIDNKEPVVRVYPLRHDLKSNAEEYITLIKAVVPHDWEGDGKTSIKAIANTLFVTQPESIQVKILGLLTDLDALHVPKNTPQAGGGFSGQGGFGADGGFFNIQE